MRFWLRLAIMVLLGCSMTGANSIAESGKQREQYFRSWASYHIPMRPVEPISYAETEPMETYYLAIYNNSGDLVRFTKYLRERGAAGRVSLAAKRSPRSMIYLEATADASGHFGAGKELSYLQTKGVPAYFKGIVDDTGLSADIEFVRQIVFFTDQYSYWPNKKLKERVMHGDDGTVIRSFFDQSGTEIPQQKK